jgi:hypothetical protein
MTAEQQAKEEFQEAYAAFFRKKAPEVRISDAGGYYVRAPVLRHYSGEDFAKITRFYQRGVQ